jgi:hypothetical protein
MAAPKNLRWFALILFLVATAGCQTSEKSMAATESDASRPQQAAWLSEMIRELEEEAPANPPAKVYRYFYNDQEVYYLTSRCCDITGKVYDVEGNLLCEPDGGITGQGDGRCPDFAETRTNETLIWEDKRES